MNMATIYHFLIKVLSAENFLQKLQKLFSDNNEKWEMILKLYINILMV